MRKKIVVCIMLILALGVTGCGNSLVKKSIEQAKTSIEIKEYDKALVSLEMALDEDNNNEEAKKLYSIVDKYQKSKKSLEENNVDEAKKLLDEINSEYINYTIKDDVDSLRQQIENKIKEIEKVENEEKDPNKETVIEEVNDDKNKLDYKEESYSTIVSNNNNNNSNNSNNNSNNSTNSNNEFTEIPVDEILEDGVIIDEAPSIQQPVIIGRCEACRADIYDVQATSITMDGYTVHSRCYGYLHQCTSCSDVYFGPLPGEGTCAKCTTICNTCGINFAIAPYMNGQCGDCYYACNKCGNVDTSTIHDPKHYCSTCKYDCIICGENYSWTGREPHGKCLTCVVNGR